MKILYLGNQTAGVIGLLTLIKTGHRVDVVGQCEEINRIAAFHSLKIIPHFYSLKSPGVIQHDLLVSVHCRNIVPKSVLDQLPLGGINVHPMLSTYKGASPIARAFGDNMTTFSVGVHRMTEKVDEGEVLVEKFIDLGSHIGPYPYEADVYAKLYPLYHIVLTEALEIVQK